MANLAEQLCDMGMPYPLAGEVILSLEIGAYAVNLNNLGMSYPLAIELARQINTRSFNANWLVNLGMPPDQAAAIISGGWYDSDALIQEDTVAGRYRYQGLTYPDLATFVAAIGGSQATLTRIYGPRLVDGASELITNGGFATDTTGWTGRNSGTIASVTAECALTGNSGSVPGFTEDVTVDANKAYRLQGKHRRGTSATSSSLVASSATSLANPAGVSAANSTTTVLDSSLTFGAEATTMRVGGRLNAAGVTGTGIFDDISLVEAEPYKGWTPGAFAGVMEFTTPGVAPSGTRYLLSADSDTTDTTTRDRNRVMAYYNSSQQVVFVVTYAGSSQTFSTLATVALSTRCKLAWSMKQDRVLLALNGAVAQIDETATFPGLSLVRVGRNAAGSAWEGTIEAYRLFAMERTSAEVEDAAGATKSAVAWGDSLTFGPATAADKYPMQASALFAPVKAVNNQGFSGQTSTQICARMGAYPILCNVSGGVIPASGALSVTSKSINTLLGAGAYSGSSIGTLAGVRGTMTTDASGNWTFTRARAGTAVSCPDGTAFIPLAGTQLRRRTAWLWLGRNGADSGYTVEGDITSAVASLRHSAYLVGSILTSTLDSAGAITIIQTRNSSLAATYGTKYVDVITALQAANDGSANDLADVAAGYTPRSLRSDELHLNAAGYAIVAARFYAAHIANGYD